MVFLTFMILVLQVDRLEKQLKERQEDVSSSPVVFFLFLSIKSWSTINMREHYWCSIASFSLYSRGVLVLVLFEQHY